MYAKRDNPQAVLSANFNQSGDASVTMAQANTANFQSRAGTKRFNNQKKMFHCGFCNNSGHTVERCYKKH